MDSVLEVRAPDGSLRRAVRLNDTCTHVQAIRRWGSELSVAVGDGKTPYASLHTLTNTGEVVRPAARLAAGTSTFSWLPLPSGIANAGSGVFPGAAFKDGTTWAVRPKTLTLTLNTRAEYVNEREYRFEGSAQLGDKTLSVAGTAHGIGNRFQPMGTPQPPGVIWEAQLSRPDGQRVGILKGSHGGASALQLVAYTENQTSYTGQLRRP